MAIYKVQPKMSARKPNDNHTKKPNPITMGNSNDTLTQTPSYNHNPSMGEH